ncbi:MAG TPA: hypothetical protein VFV67_26985 [Actinophytocola sp.]|uniref:hypothetical protein n=1 Tax=Actinophytocola sp. TaxID=1872138 RepID=UPI002DB9929F|nr:hypothetical protein [Actinophytocola sp.]HEU5474310.1 hypothetical protein [Actinophytocola sp.]
MLRRIAMAAAAAFTLSLVLTACDSGSSADNAGGGDAVAWAEKVCSSVEDEVAALNEAPNVDPSDPVKAKDDMVAYLSSISNTIDTLIGNLNDAGDPPVADGSVAVDKVTATLTDVKTTVDGAKTKLEQASPADPAAFQKAFQQVAADMGKFATLEDPTKDLAASKELNDAFSKAETCKKAGMGAGSTSSAPTS